jgi:ABC-type antimicrobial peptide transport system permease subunit
MMSALGFRRRLLAGLVLAENLVLLALGLGLGVAAALLATAPHLAAHASRVPWLPLALTLAAVLVVGCLASLAAVVATARTPLVPALRSE